MSISLGGGREGSCVGPGVGMYTTFFLGDEREMARLALTTV